MRRLLHEIYENRRFLSGTSFGVPELLQGFHLLQHLLAAEVLAVEYDGVCPSQLVPVGRGVAILFSKLQNLLSFVSYAAGK